jgi:hypothetical protein
MAALQPDPCARLSERFLSIFVQQQVGVIYRGGLIDRHGKDDIPAILGIQRSAGL